MRPAPNRFVRRAPCLLAPALALALSACDLLGDDLAEARADLRRNRTRWESQGIRDYTFSVSPACQVCGFGPVTVQVRNGQPVSHTPPAGTQLPPQAAQILAGYDTIDELLDRVEEGLEHDPDEFRVRYFAETGVPQDVWFDYEINTADEENGFGVQSFSIDQTNLAGAGG